MTMAYCCAGFLSEFLDQIQCWREYRDGIRHKAQLKFKWIKELNVNPTTLNLIEEKVGSKLNRTGTEDHFLNITPVAQTLRATINKWDLLKWRSFCKAKDTVNKTKRHPTE